MKELEHDEVKDAVSVIDTVLQSHPYRNALLVAEENLVKEIAVEADEARKAKLEKNLVKYEWYIKSIYTKIAIY